MFCKRCRYNLKLIESRACAECGRAFEPGNPKTYHKGVGWPKWLRRLFQGLAVLFVVVLIALGVIEVRYQQELAAAEALEQVGADLDWADDAHQWAEGIPFLHERLQHVSGMHLFSEQLTTLPPEIGKLTKLEVLDLANNQLTTLPPEIGKLTKLGVLWLTNNQLTTLPSEIGKLTNLKGLYLMNNQLATLPPEIGKLTELQDLRLNHNPITDADLEPLKLLRSLLGLDLRGTTVTQQGVAALKLALPNCTIISDFSGGIP